MSKSSKQFLQQQEDFHAEQQEAERQASIDRMLYIQGVEKQPKVTMMQPEHTTQLLTPLN